MFELEHRRLADRMKMTAIALAVALLTLVGSTVVCVHQTTSLRTATSEQSELFLWVQALHSVELSLNLAETGQRGYLLTGDQRYLAPYSAAVKTLPDALLHLHSLPIHDAVTYARVQDVQTQAALKLDELAATIRLYDQDRRAEALAQVQGGSGQAYMEKLRDDISALFESVRSRRTSIVNHILSTSRNALGFSVFTLLAVLVTVALTATQVRQWIAAQHRYQESVTASEQFMRTLTDHLPVRLRYLDAAGQVQFVNRAAREAAAKAREELAGGRAAEGEAAGVSMWARAMTAVREGQAQRFEHTEGVGDAIRTFETHLVPDMSANGHLKGTVEIGVDITHLKEVEQGLRELTEVFEATPDVVVQTDPQGRLKYINPAGRRAVGLLPDEAIEQYRLPDYLSPASSAQLTQTAWPSVERHRVWIGESRLNLAVQGTLPVSHLLIAHHDAGGRLIRYSSLMRDISAQRATRQQIARQRAILNAVLEAIPATVTVWDTQYRYVLVNNAFERARGRERQQIIGHTLADVFGESEYRISLPWAQRALAGETVSYEKNTATGAISRHLAVTYVPLYLKDGAIGGVVSIAHDITRQRDEHVRLLALSERDPLTGLLNRAGAQSYFSRATGQRESAPRALLYVDLDRFKPINDTYGHSVGDDVLREFGSALQALVRPTDAVARLGGDEFCVILVGLREQNGALMLAQRIIEMATRPLIVNAAPFVVGASIGVAFDATATLDWQGLVERADRAVYQAKARGRGQFVVSDEASAAGHS